MRILYICYHRLLEPLGEATVLPYLKCLSECGVKLNVVSFEKKQNFSGVNDLKQQLNKDDIVWNPLVYRYGIRFISGIINVLSGMLVAYKLIKKQDIKFIYAKGTIAGLIATALKLKFKNIKIVFDNDGFWAQERKDAAIWGNVPFVYKLCFLVEEFVYKKSDYFVVLTSYAATYLQQKNLDKPIFIRPICAAKQFFKEIIPDIPEAVFLRDKVSLIYTGAVGTWYMLPEMIDFFKILQEKEPNAFFVFLTYPQNIAKVKKAFISKGIKEDSFWVKHIEHKNIAKWYSGVSGGIYFIKPFISKKHSSPTKLAEMQASGLFIITNTGVGDADKILAENNTGVICDEFTIDNYSQCADRFLEAVKERGTSLRCRETAFKYLSMETAKNIYLEMLKQLEVDSS